MANENYPIIVGGLKKIGNFFIKELKYELKEQEHIATKKLYDSFYSDIYEQFGNLYLDVTSDVDYMWIVNDGASMGVQVEEEDIIAWAKAKRITFNNPIDEARFAESVVRQLASQYYTEGGKLVAPRRYNFIGYAFARAEGSGIIEQIEEDIYNTVEREIGLGLSGKVIQLTIS